MVNWEDLKANTKELVSDLKREKIGIVGLALIVLMVSIALLTPVLAPGAGEEWRGGGERWDDNPERAPPKWFDYITTTDYAHHEVHGEEDFEKELLYDEDEGKEKIELNFSRYVDYDRPPQEFFFNIQGESGGENVTEVKFTVDRPELDWHRFDLDVGFEEDLEREYDLEKEYDFPTELNQENTASDELIDAFMEEGRPLQTENSLFDFEEDGGYEQYLEKGEIAGGLVSAFAGRGHMLDPTTQLVEEDEEWLVVEDEDFEPGEELFRIEVVQDVTLRVEAVAVEQEPQEFYLERYGAGFYEEFFDVDEAEREIPEELEKIFEFEGYQFDDDAILDRREELFSLDREQFDIEEGPVVGDWVDEFIEQGFPLPPETNLTRLELFTLPEPVYEEYLEEGPVHENLTEAFADEGFEIEDAELQENDHWVVEEDGEETYRIQSRENDLFMMNKTAENIEEDHLLAGDLHENITDALEGEDLEIGENATISGVEDEAEWIISEDGVETYRLREDEEDDEWLEVYERELRVTEIGEWRLVTDEDTEDEEYQYRIVVEEEELSIRPLIEIWFADGVRDPETFRIELDDDIEVYHHDTTIVSEEPVEGTEPEEVKEGVEDYYYLAGANRFEEFRLEVRDDVIEVYHNPADRDAHVFDEWVVYRNTVPNLSDDFEIRETLRRSSEFREIARDKGHIYLRTYEGVPDGEIPDAIEIGNPVHVLQSTLTENKLDEAELDVLRGEYEVNVEIWGEEMTEEEFDEGAGANIELDEEETTLTFSGAVYGLMGTDRDRRDLWQGWVHGARWGLLAGGIVAVATIVLSTLYGMTSAYYGGWVDELMSRINEIMIGIPTLPLLIIILLYWQSIWAFIILYAALMWRGAARVIRARGLQVAKDTYIEASEALGSGSGRIIRRHMIPQILPYAFAQASLLIPVVIMAEAGLHILGLGDQTIVTWGTILNNARAEGALLNPSRSWWWVLLPGLGMVMVGFGFIATGMALERIINPKMQQR